MENQGNQKDSLFRQDGFGRWPLPPNGAGKHAPKPGGETFAIQGCGVQAYDVQQLADSPFQGHKDPNSWAKTTCATCFSTPILTALSSTTKKRQHRRVLGHDVVDGDDALRLKVHVEKTATYGLSTFDPIPF